ncbi:MAG: DMT family transporter [Galactobacter sp.]
MSARPSEPARSDPRGRRRNVIIAIVCLLGATLFWAGNYVVGAHAVAEIDPVSLVLLRWALALVPLVIIAQVVERPNWRTVFAAWPWLLLLSGLGLLGYNLLLYFALEHTTAFDASLINAFNPALITLAAAMFLRLRLTAWSVGGVLTALVGVLVVLSDGDLGRLVGTGFGTGQLLMLGAIVVWTGYTIVGRLAPPLPPISSTAVQAGMSVVMVAPISLAVGGPTWPTSTSALLSLIFIALFPSVGSYLLWNRALTLIPASSAGVFLNLITVFTAIITMVGGQPVTASQLIGGAVVIAGVAITNAPTLVPALRTRS